MTLVERVAASFEEVYPGLLGKEEAIKLARAAINVVMEDGANFHEVESRLDIETEQGPVGSVTFSKDTTVIKLIEHIGGDVRVTMVHRKLPEPT